MDKAAAVVADGKEGAVGEELGVESVTKKFLQLEISFQQLLVESSCGVLQKTKNKEGVKKKIKGRTLYLLVCPV